MKMLLIRVIINNLLSALDPAPSPSPQGRGEETAAFAPSRLLIKKGYSFGAASFLMKI
jgi:hypothetical protein